MKKKAIQSKSFLPEKVDFNRIEEITNIGSFVWNLNENHLVCTSNLLRIVNKNPEHTKLDKDVFFKLIDTDSRNFVLDVMHDCIISNSEFEVTFNLKDQDKKIRLLGYPQGDTTTKQIIGLIQDLSESEEANKALLKGQDDERKRISLELHDSIGQKLIAAKYQLALIKVDPSDDKYDNLNELINHIVSEVRNITHNLSSEMVSEVGLQNAIGHILSDTASFLKAKKEYRYELKDSNNCELLPNDEAGKMIYRIIQEALTNIAKHSGATLIRLALLVINNQLIITINDNGKGMTSEHTKRSGIGMRNIKERVAYLSGFVRFKSQSDKGVEINIKIPLTNVL